MNGEKTVFDQDMEILSNLSRRLNGLTSDPQPGMISWMAALVDVMTEMKATLTRIGVE